MPRGTNAPKLWPAEPRRWMSMVPSGRPVAAAAPGDLGAEHRADGAVDVADGALDVHRLAPVQRRLGRLDERHVEGPIEAVVLRDRVVQRLAVAVLGRGEDRRQVEAVRLPVVDGRAGVEHLDVADRLLQRAEPERRRAARAPPRR